MNNKLKKSVQNYLHSKQLNKDQLDNLDKLINQVEAKPAKSSLFIFNMTAAIFVLAIIAGLFWMTNPKHKVDISELIAEEVAYNHLKMTPIEVSSNSLNDMRNYFSKLDFSLSHSKYVDEIGLQLIGGRYCSIQGGAAAQLRMKNQQTGDIQIVYQAPYNKKLFRDLPKLYQDQQPVREYVNGIAVDIWVEKGILFARSYKQ